MFVFERDEYPLLQAIKRIIFDRHENYYMLVLGPPQVGKSTTIHNWGNIWSEKMGLDPTYNLKDRWALADPERFIEIHNQKLKRGALVVFDEGGVGLDNQLWYTMMSRAVVHTAHTHGHEGTFNIITSLTGDINKKVKKIIKGLLVIKKKSKDHAIGSFFEVEYNQKDDKIYYKFPMLVQEDGSTAKVREIVMKKPSRKICREYNNFSKPLKVQLKEKLLGDIHHEKIKEKKKEFDYKSMVKKIKSKPENFTKTHWNKLLWDRYKMMNEFDIGRPRAERLVAMLPEPKELMFDEDKFVKI